MTRYVLRLRALLEGFARRGGVSLGLQNIPTAEILHLY
jgi:hypothetical protein